MHVVLVTLGTDGDVFPHIGLGAALKSRGHRVTLAAPETYRAQASEQGMEFSSLVTAEEVARMLADPDLWRPIRSGIMMARWGAPMMPRQYQAISELVARDDCILVANPGVVAARLVGETMGVPTASLLLQPGLLPSCTAPPKMPAGPTVPAWAPHAIKRLYWSGVDLFAYAVVTPALNRLRGELGLPPVRRFFDWWLSPELVIGLFPEWYAARQPDWPPRIRLAGFGRFEGTTASLPDDVRRFCEAGPPPVAFTLGTGMTHAAGFFRNAAEACEKSGVRGVVLTKHPATVPERLPSTVLHCTFAPFRQLLPLCAAFVHHGGIGSTAAALEAGCPQLVVPLAWDQPDNGDRVTKLGVGLTLGRRRRQSGDIAGALTRLVSDEFREQCRVVAGRFGEDGLDVAARLVEDFGVNSRTGRRASAPA